MIDLENLKQHYATTIEQWLTNYVDVADQIRRGFPCFRPFHNAWKLRIQRMRRPSVCRRQTRSQGWALSMSYVNWALLTMDFGNRNAHARLVRFGLNVLPRPKQRGWYLQLLANFVHLFAILLWVAAALAWVGQMPQLAVAIVAVVLINGVFSYWQQYRADQAIEALEELLPQTAMVRRDGQQCAINATQLAIGDIILLSQGDAVAADARLITANRLRIDLSSLSGESRRSHAMPNKLRPAR